MARKPYTDKDNTFRQWRTNTNTISNAVGDPDAVVYVDTYSQANIDLYNATLEKHQTVTKSATWTSGSNTLNLSAATDARPIRIGMVAISHSIPVNAVVTSVNYTTGAITIDKNTSAAQATLTGVVFQDTAFSHVSDLELRKVNRTGDTIGNLNITGNLTVDGTSATNQVLAIDGTAAALKSLQSADQTVAFTHTATTIDIKTTGVFPDAIVVKDSLTFGSKTTPTSTVGYLSVATGAGLQGGIPIGSSSTYETLIKVGTHTAAGATGNITQVQFPTATWRSVEYLVQVRNAANTAFMTTKLMVVHNGTDTFVTEYGTIRTVSMTHDFSVTISAGNLELDYSGAAVGDVIRVYATAMRV